MYSGEETTTQFIFTLLSEHPLKPLFIVLLFACSLTTTSTHAQKNDIGFKSESRSTNWIKTKVARARKQCNGLGPSVGMNMSFFMNPSFGQSIEQGNLNHDFKAKYIPSQFGLRAVLLPLIIDHYYFASVPFASSNSPTGINSNFRHKGMVFSMSLALITFSPYIYPYAGIGFSVSGIDNSAAMFSSGSARASTMAPMWKIGVNINPTARLFIFAEYTSSVNRIDAIGYDLNSSRSFGMAQFGFGYMFTKFKFR